MIYIIIAGRIYSILDITSDCSPMYAHEMKIGNHIRFTSHLVAKQTMSLMSLLG